jgi:hypothetical protein
VYLSGHAAFGLANGFAMIYVRRAAGITDYEMHLPLIFEY